MPDPAVTLALAVVTTCEEVQKSVPSAEPLNQSMRPPLDDEHADNGVTAVMFFLKATPTTCTLSSLTTRATPLTLSPTRRPATSPTTAATSTATTPGTG